MDVFHSTRQFDGSLPFHSVEQGLSTPSRDLGTVIRTPLIEVFWPHSAGCQLSHIRKQFGMTRRFFFLLFLFFAFVFLFYFCCCLTCLSAGRQLSHIRKQFRMTRHFFPPFSVLFLLLFDLAFCLCLVGRLACFAGCLSIRRLFSFLCFIY